MSESGSLECTVTDQPTKREKYQLFNSLSCLVKSLEGHNTVIDLRNENIVSGKVVKVDGWMNVEMEDVVFYDARTEHLFSQFFVTKRHIRYVHIPKGFSAIELMKDQLNRMSRGRFTKKTPHTFKKVRAKRYQQEIIKSAFNKGPSTSSK
ncbi:U7 snRNA-associated Sm-like protein LSm10 isoform X2 [Leptinotarsa decemlineata]|uniref:U7 snRNA-associated Sm-like protein LSm10 isoform X2 n=1 Tax=Leptinotarsa decemlineata TaxID=7539 RepID=UPI003D308AA9